VLNNLVLIIQVAVDLHVDHFTLSSLGNELKVDTSNNLGLGGKDGLKSEIQVQVLRNFLQTGGGSINDQFHGGVGLRGPCTDRLLSGPHVGVDSLNLTQASSLSSSETLGYLSLISAQVDTPLHLEVTVITPSGVPGVGIRPVVSAVLSSPTDQLDTMSTNVCTISLGVDTTGVAGEEAVEVLVDGEASLEGPVVHQLGLVQVQIVVAKAGERLEGASLVNFGPGGFIVTGVNGVMALGGSSRARVVRSTAREALVGANSVTTVIDDPVPGSGGEATVTALLGALKDRFRGDDGARGGLTVDAKTVSEGLLGTEVPTRTTALLVEDEESTMLPFSTSVKVSGDRRPDDESCQSSEKNNLQHHSK